MVEASRARTMWEAVERFHSLTYMAPEVREEGTAAGLKGFWMNYFATRIAPVGPVGSQVVESTFFYYAPKRVHRAIPDAWSFASPQAIIDARYRGMDRALRNTYDDVTSAQFIEAVERFHSLTYMAPEVREEGTAAGLKGFWMNYFATRIAPVGPVGPRVVESTFFYYAAKRVHRAIPDAWSFASPQAIIDARYRGMDRALRNTYDDVASAQFIEAADLVREAAAGCEPIGRLLYAGWASLDWPAEPHLALWHGCTLLREYRSGNHLIALCAEGLDGIESIISHVAVGGAPEEWIHDEAGWSDAEQAAAVSRLQMRGWLDTGGAATAECRAGRARIEAMTDALDLPAWERLGDRGCERLVALMSDFATVLPADDQLDWQQIYT